MAIGAFLKVGAKLLSKGAKVGSKVKSSTRKINPKKIFGKSGKGKKTDKKINSALSLFKKSDKNEKKSIVKFDKEKARERARQKAKEEESKLESKNNKKRNRFSRLKKAGGSILSKIIDFLTTILIGWVVDKLPKILKFAQNITDKIKQIYDSIVNFGKTVGEFFTKIKDAIGGVFEKIKEFDFSKIGENIKKKISGIKDGFTNMIDKIKGGLGILKKKEKQDPKKLAKEGKIEEGKEEDVDIDKLGTDTDKLMTEGEKEFKKFDESLKKGDTYINVENTIIEKDNKKIKVDKLMTPSEGSAVKEFKKDPTATTSSDGKKGDAPLIKSDQTTITSDGMTFPKGLSGSGETFGGEGGSAYGDGLNISKSEKTMLNSSNTTKVDKSQIANNLVKSNTKKRVTVNNPINIPNQGGGSGQGGTELIVIKTKKSDILKEKQLINSSYT